MTAAYAGPPVGVACPECGFAGEYRTPGIAAKSLAKHSCDHQRKLTARAARVVARRTREGEKRDCVCKVANHEHGTRTAYVVDRCRCRSCTDASTAHRAELNKQKAFGRYDTGRVDAIPARAHTRYLMAEGISIRQIARIAGVSMSTIRCLLYGRHERGHDPYPRINRDIAEKILAIKPVLANMASGHCTDATGTQRRLQALVAIGWSQSRLARKLGIQPSNFITFMNADQCTAKRALQVKELYDRLWNQPQTGTDWHSKAAATRAKHYADARGWVPPLAWDDDCIDDPTAVPDVGAKVYAQGQTPAGAIRKSDATAEDVEFLLDEGMTWDSIPNRLGMKPKSLERLLQRLGRSDLVARAKTMTERLAYARAS